MQRNANEESVNLYNACYGETAKPLKEVTRQLEALQKVRTVSHDLTRRVIKWDTQRQ